MRLRILVVEDEAQIADFIVRGLREEGFAVEHLANGADASQALRTATWDVVLLDWWLPAKDGLTVLRELREAGNMTPVLMLTARDAVSDRVRGLDTGADDYLCKPFAFVELLARIRVLSRRRAAGEGANLVLEYEDVSVNLAKHRTERAGRRLDLTTKEEALLGFFLRHPNEVLSRSRIYEHVWDDRYDRMSNTLEVHVAELRRKLEAHGPRLIHTFRNRGYMLSEARATKKTSARSRLSE